MAAEHSPYFSSPHTALAAHRLHSLQATAQRTETMPQARYNRRYVHLFTSMLGEFIYVCAGGYGNLMVMRNLGRHAFGQ